MPQFHKHLGDLYFDDFKLDAAIAEYKTSIQLDPNDPETYIPLGFACYMSGFVGNDGMFEEAAAAFEQAIALSPLDAVAHYGLGISYESLGDTDRAFNVYFKLKTLDEEWAKKLQDDLVKDYNMDEDE